MKPRKYDFVIYGATGFVGRQAVAYCVKHAPRQLKWAIAGRNLEKLQESRRFFGGDNPAIDILVADYQDQQAIDAIVEQTRIILSAAGPFAVHGENLVAGCCRFGTDYLDITGETVFISRMIEKYEDQAKASGAKIIPFCGFDAVPSDLGVLIAVKYINDKLHCGTRSAGGFFSIKGGFNGGTIATLLNMFESGAWPEMKNTGILLTKQNLKLAGQESKGGIRYDRDLRSWTAPFMMSPINIPVVNRSASLSADWGDGYGADFQYDEFHRLGKWWNPFPALLVSLALRISDRLGKSSFYQRFIRLVGPKPGEGPSTKSINKGFFCLDVIAKAESGKKVRVQLSGSGDPSNMVTVKCLCEAAFSLAEQRNALPGGAGRCGFLTPATGLGSILIARLEEAGLRISSETI